MKKYNGLLAEIAREFHIEQGEAESMERWKARIVYSLLGRMAYASLRACLKSFDKRETVIDNRGKRVGDEENASISE